MAKKIERLQDIQPDSANPNRGTPRGLAFVEDSIQRYGWGRSILLDAEGRVIAGNKSLESAVSVGLEDVIVVPSDGTKIVAVQRTDLDLERDKAARELSISDNRSSEVGLAWDVEVLQEDAAAGIDLGQWWTEEELAELLAPEPESGLLEGADPDAIPENVETRCKPGDLWQLGVHRLAVCDCTDPASVARLMAGERAKLLVTDPPYAVDYVAKARDMNERGYGHSRATLSAAIEGDAIDEEGAVDLWRGAFCVGWAEALEEDAALYVWHAQGRAMLALYNLLAELGVLHHQTIIWEKENFVIGRCDYQWIHEPCFYGWKKGNRPPFYGPKNQTTVWNVARDTQHPEHPTQKPVALFEPPIANHLKPGEILYDPFVGSGTAIIGAENQGARCFACEVSARHADTCLARWEQATGKSAVRLE